MKELLQKLNKLTGTTFYLCDVASKKMSTIHDGAAFEAATPEWLQKFIIGANLLIFEQKGQRKQYFRWNIDENTVVAILDDTGYGSLTKILNKMLLCLDNAGEAPVAEAISSPADSKATSELKAANDKLAGIQRRLETALKEKKTAEDNVSRLTTQVSGLMDQSRDQSARLQEALAKNQDLSREISQAQMELSEGAKARGAVTLIRDENNRLQEQLKALEERYKKLSDAFDALKAGGGTTATAAGAESQADSGKGLVRLINALNTIIATGNADTLDLKKLEMFVHVPNKRELEQNPNAVKAIISKLLGMERSGQLTAFQMKKLNEVVL